MQKKCKLKKVQDKLREPTKVLRNAPAPVTNDSLELNLEAVLRELHTLKGGLDKIVQYPVGWLFWRESFGHAVLES